jgi:hypothetical protein
LVGNARGRGLIGTLELVRNKETKEPFKPADAIAAHAGKRAQVHGVVTRALGDNYSLCPPLIITEAQINDMFDRSERALADTYTWARANNLYKICVEGRRGRHLKSFPISSSLVPPQFSVEGPRMPDTLSKSKKL